MHIDNVSRRILDLVQRNNQMSSEAIAAIVGASASTVQRRLHALRRDKLIEADVSVLSPERLGRKLLIIMEVVMEREHPNVLSELKKSMSARDEVMQCYYVTGKSDFVMIMTFHDMAEYEGFCERYIMSNKNVKRFYTNVVISRVKFGLAIPL